MNELEVDRVEEPIIDKTEVAQVNYWKEIKKEINETINEMRGLVLVTHNSIEFSDIVDFLNKVRKDEQVTILYISLTNSYTHMKRMFEEKPLVSKRFFVIDCVSGFLIELQDEINCVYRKPPSNLEEMKEIILKNINVCNPDIIVMDSLSQFINFSMPKEWELREFYMFLKEIKNNVMGIINDTVILFYDDKLGSMKRLPTMFTNLILKLEVIREKVEWRD